MKADEVYDLILDFILDPKSNGSAHRSNLKYHNLLPDLEGFQINDILVHMGQLAPEAFKPVLNAAKDTVLFKNERTAFFKRKVDLNPS